MRTSPLPKSGAASSLGIHQHASPASHALKFQISDLKSAFVPSFAVAGVAPDFTSGIRHRVPHPLHSKGADVVLFLNPAAASNLGIHQHASPASHALKFQISDLKSAFAPSSALAPVAPDFTSGIRTGCRTLCTPRVRTSPLPKSGAASSLGIHQHVPPASPSLKFQISDLKSAFAPSSALAPVAPDFTSGIRHRVPHPLHSKGADVVLFLNPAAASNLGIHQHVPPASPSLKFQISDLKSAFAQSSALAPVAPDFTSCIRRRVPHSLHSKGADVVLFLNPAAASSLGIHQHASPASHALKFQTSNLKSAFAQSSALAPVAPDFTSCIRRRVPHPLHSKGADVATS